MSIGFSQIFSFQYFSSNIIRFSASSWSLVFRTKKTARKAIFCAFLCPKLQKNTKQSLCTTHFLKFIRFSDITILYSHWLWNSYCSKVIWYKILNTLNSGDEMYSKRSQYNYPIAKIKRWISCILIFLESCLRNCLLSLLSLL